MASNFLEQLIREWFEFKNNFVRTNIKFGKLNHGGWTGEMDVLVLDPKDGTATHIEASSDARTWADRRVIVEKKFSDASKHYAGVLPKGVNVTRKLAIIGTSINPNEHLDLDGIQEMSIPDFIKSVSDGIRGSNPMNEAVPEHWPLLRAIQFAFHWG